MNLLKDREGYLFSNNDLKRLIFPLLIEQLLAITVGMADSIMVSSVGEAAVSAVSLVDTIFVLLINMFAALATGGAVVCGQYIGKKRQQQACEAADQLILATAMISILIMGMMYLIRPFILHVVFGSITEEVERNCNIYLLIVSASIPFISIYNAGAALFRAQGNSKTPMKISIIMNGINIVGNALFLYGLHFGVAGAAIPTLLSRVFAAIVITILIYNPRYMLHCSRPITWKLHWPTLRKILYIGVPNGLENSMFQLGKILVLSMITQFGTAAIAANAVSNTLAIFQNIGGMAIGNAIVTVSAQCAGANAYDQVRYYTKKLMMIIYGAVIVGSIGIILLLPFLLGIYNLSPEATQMAQKIITYHGLCCMFIWPLSFSLPNTLRASNDVTFCMIVSGLSMWICRIGFSYIIGVYLGLGVFGVWVAMTLDWVARAIFFVGRYRTGKWQHQVE